jgi:prepilin-type N-terminal cleavage/methylation domain-containing protein
MRSPEVAARNCDAPAGPRRGVSIIEVLVALVLLAVALLGMAGSGAIATRASANAARERRAVQRAGDRLAALREQGSRRRAQWPPSPISVRHSSSAGRSGRSAGGAVLADVEVRWRARRANERSLLRGGLLC